MEPDGQEPISDQSAKKIQARMEKSTFPEVSKASPDSESGYG